MINKLLGLAVALALPTMVAAQTPQIPDEHASERGQAMVALCTRKVLCTARGIGAERWSRFRRRGPFA